MQTRLPLLLAFLPIATLHYSLVGGDQALLNNLFNHTGNFPAGQQLQAAQGLASSLSLNMPREQLTPRGVQVLAALEKYCQTKGIPSAEARIHALYSILTDAPSFYPGKSAARYPERTSCLQGYNSTWKPWGQPNDTYRHLYQRLSSELDAQAPNFPESPRVFIDGALALPESAQQAAQEKTRSRLNIATGVGISVSALGLAWLFTTVRNKRNRELLVKAWRQLTSAEYRQELTRSPAPLEVELISSHGREVLAALLVTATGAVLTAYGAKRP